MARESLVWCVLLTVNLMIMLLQISPMGRPAAAFPSFGSNHYNDGNNEEEGGNACHRVRAGHFVFCKYVDSQKSYLQGVERLESWIGKLLFPNHHHVSDYV
ncbi:hypothetical protein BASA81_008336 [Batrachochytrium salamandrivorans]|nr:hypothetical protein BASA81_008336 [Batrachochytrium salamandrivorans]